ncbi:MAG: hypothetical protein M0R80_26580 [Proteobacteria bacterium]|nr:hypothetical protein [Pseudomonadota bacterium]
MSKVAVWVWVDPVPDVLVVDETSTAWEWSLFVVSTVMVWLWLSLVIGASLLAVVPPYAHPPHA